MADRHIGSAAAELLLDLADRAIADGLDGRDCPDRGRLVEGRPAVPDVAQLPPELRQPRGSFVSLHVGGQLNGCIGSIEPTNPLGVSVADQAWSAAFADPRLPPLRRGDYDDLDIEVSILSTLTSIPSSSRDELLVGLRRDVDGLLIVSGTRRAVFLPTVWSQLPDADEFLDRLALKAGLDIVAWPPDLHAFTFRTESIRRPSRSQTSRSQAGRSQSSSSSRSTTWR